MFSKSYFLIRFILFTTVLISIVSCKDQNTLKADKLFENKQYKEAIVVYDEYLKLHPTHVKSIYNKGRAYEELGQYEQAFKEYQTALDLDKKNTSAMLSIATYNYRIEDFEIAAYMAQKAIDENPQLTNAYFWLGRSNHQLGKFKEAMEAYEKAIKLSPDNGEVYLYRGLLYLVQKNKRKGCIDLQKAKDLNIAEADAALNSYCK
uniref:tetratricopeptide repeat protein n=1 Tax=Fulvivirga sp. TaxID=1931237 RepID=UPI00404B4AE3